MITQNGFSSFLAKSYFNFEVSLLQKTIVVVHGDDFIYFVLNNVIGFEDNEHNESLLFSMYASELISRLQMCSIQPLFIFDGCIKSEQNELRYSDQMWSVINSYKSSFVDVLSFFGIKYMTSLYSAKFDAAALSIYLNCPLIASSYDIYYMFSTQATKTEANLMQELIYLPIHLLDFFTCKSDDVILSHIFHQKFSNLSSVVPPLRPILSVLYSESFEIRVKVCQELKWDGMNSSDDINFRSHEWFVLVNWLVNSSTTNYATLYENVIQAHQIEERRSVTEYLLDCIEAFMGNIAQKGYEVASYFNLIISSFNVPVGTLIETDEKSNASVNLQHIPRLASVLNPKQPIKFSFTHNWPTELVELYRNAKLSPVIIDILHHSIRKAFPSVHAYSIDLRLIVYRILYGLEDSAGVKLDPNIIEYSWLNNNVPTEISLTISPLLIDANNSADEIISSQINIPLSQHTPSPDWIFSLAITLAFWYQQYLVSTDQDNRCHFENSPIGLSIAVCAVVNVFNIDFMSSNLQEHYKRLINFIRKEMSQKSKSVFSPDQSTLLCTKYVTKQNLSNLTAIQHIYNELQTVILMLNCLVGSENKSKLFTFLPRWILFPSSHLVDCLSCYLGNQLPSVRFVHVTSYWIPRLCAKKSNSLITDVTYIFKRLVNIVTLLSESSLFNLTGKSERCTVTTEDTNATNVNYNVAMCQDSKMSFKASSVEIVSVHHKHGDAHVVNRSPLYDLTEKQNIM